jgi:hypothetical protein
VTDSLAVFETSPNFAVIVAVIVALTPFVVMVNVVEELPAGIVTVAGTVADVLLEVRVTVVEDPGAAPRLTVPVAVAPPCTVVGDTLSEERVGTLTVRSCENVTPPLEADITVAAVPVTVDLPVIANVWEVDPAGTVTDAGTVAAATLLDARVTVRPPDGAALDSVTVPLIVPPGVTEDVANCRLTIEETAELWFNASRHRPRPYVPAFR